MEARVFTGFFHFHLVLSGTSWSCEVGGFRWHFAWHRTSPIPSASSIPSARFLQLMAAKSPKPLILKTVACTKTRLLAAGIAHMPANSHRRSAGNTSLQSKRPRLEKLDFGERPGQSRHGIGAKPYASLGTTQVRKQPYADRRPSELTAEEQPANRCPLRAT